MIEKILYKIAVKDMCDRARYKLKNFMAHGYEIDSTVNMTVLERNGENIMIDKSGNIWKAEKAL